MRIIFITTVMLGIISIPAITVANDRYDCRSNERDQVAGVLVGGLIGGLVGSEIAGRGSRTEGAIIGSVVGGVTGAAITNSDDCRPRRNNQYNANYAGSGYYNNTGYYQQPR